MLIIAPVLVDYSAFPVRELSDHCIDHVFKGLELADESVVIHLIVGLESNECRVYLYAGFIGLPRTISAKRIMKVLIIAPS